MKTTPLILLMLGVWLGMILGISFLETPLKFKAPNITLTLGLGIGRLVFSMFNKIEIVFSVFLILFFVTQKKGLDLSIMSSLLGLILLVLLQSFWLLPILSSQVDYLIMGVEVAKSNHHFYYRGIECLKVLLLIYSFLKIYKHE